MSELHAEARAEAVVDAGELPCHDDLDPETFLLSPQGVETAGPPETPGRVGGDR